MLALLGEIILKGETSGEYLVNCPQVPGLYLTGVRGFDPPQEVADPHKVLQNLFGGVDSNPPKNPPIPFSC